MYFFQWNHFKSSAFYPVPPKEIRIAEIRIRFLEKVIIFKQTETMEFINKWGQVPPHSFP